MNSLLQTVSWRSAPVCLTLLTFSIAGFLLVYLGAPIKVVNWFTFTPFDIRGGEVVLQPVSGQYWRWITPIFLHFSWLHIVFNGLWLWELGSRIEYLLGSTVLLILVLVLAVSSNTVQFLFGGYGIFGGLSGVVYGLLGFCWAAPLIQRRWPLKPPTPILVLMLVWLALGLVGAVEMLGFGAIANAAHIGGLLAGLVLGVLVALCYPRPRF